MTNHIHLLVTPKVEGAVSTMLQDLGRVYVRTINLLHERTGTLWEGRFKSTVVDSETYLLACYRYIEMNPVRARLVTSPDAYPWSSYPHNVGAQENPLIEEHPTYNALGTTRQARHAAYASLFHSELDASEVGAIRHATNRGTPLGSEDFLARASAAAGRDVRPKEPGRPRKTQENQLGIFDN
jgi:putative transposase